METMNIFQLCIGLYLLYAALKGSGKLYENEYLKVPRKQYVKTLRIMALVTAVFVVAGAALELAGVFSAGEPLAWVFWALSFAGVIVMAVYSVRCTDRKKAKAASSAPPTIKKDSLKAAFEFDEEEKQQDDATKQAK